MAKYSEFLQEAPPPQKRRAWLRFIRRHIPSVSVLFMATLLAITLLYPYVVITVQSGQVGVLWRRFFGFDAYCWCFAGRGTALDPREIREEGLHIIWPWDKLFIYNLRLQSATQTYNAISKDGVSVTAQINVRFQLSHNSVGVLQKFIGPDYLQLIVSPEIGSQARSVISQYSAQEVYTSREAIQEKIRDNSQKSLGAHLNKLVQPEAMEELDPKHYTDYLQGSIQILDTLVLGIELPPEIVAAINRQTEQYYMIQEYRFRVEREAEESKRKQIEADGIAAFQKTVSQGISESYLRWRGIEATLLLAQSPNSKVVIIGSGRDGLPIILNAEPNAQGGAPQPGASTGSSSGSGGSGAPGNSGASGAGNSSAPLSNTPPSTSSGAPPNSSTAPGSTPGAPGTTPNKPPPGTSGALSPPTPEQTVSAASGATEEAKTAPVKTGVEIPGVRSILSGISGVLRAGADLTSPEPKSKQ